MFDTAIGRVVESPTDVFGMVESALRGRTATWQPGYLLVSRRPLVLSMAHVRSRGGALDAQSLDALTTIYGAVPLRAALERANLALDGPAARDGIARFGGLDTMVQSSDAAALGELFTRHAPEVIAGCNARTRARSAISPRRV